MSEQQSDPHNRGFLRVFPSREALLRNPWLTLLVVCAIAIFAIGAGMAFRWTAVSYLTPVSREDVVQIAGLVIAVSAVVLAGSFLVTIAIPFMAVREIKESLAELERNAEKMMTDKLSKIVDLQNELYRLEKLAQSFQSPEEIFAVVDRKVEESDKVIRDMIREKFKPAWDLEKQILTVVERDVYQTLISGGLIKNRPSPPKRADKAA